MKYEDEQFEGLLNDSLKELREAEPRAGLEGRVLRPEHARQVMSDSAGGVGQRWQ